nr:MAG TPA: hypothetical protein [Caudoviricetes sp.]
MDAVKFLKEKQRMCKSFERCSKCVFAEQQYDCDDYALTCPEKSVSIVESWAKEHPAKTRQSELLKMFPNAEIKENGVLAICPSHCDKSLKCIYEQTETGANLPNCKKYRRDFWLTEIES